MENQLRAQLDQLSQRLDNAKKVFREQKQELIDKDTEIQQLKNTITQLESTVKSKDTEIEMLQSDLDVKTADINICKLTITDRDNKLLEKNQKVDELEQEVKNLQNMNIENQKTINEWKSEAEPYYKKIIQEQKEELNSLDKIRLDYAASLEQTLGELSEAKDKIKELEQNSEMLNSEVNSLNCKCTDLEEKLNEANDLVKALESSNCMKDQDTKRLKEQYAERIAHISNTVNDVHNQLQSTFDIFSI
jgi:chromosome segregation ATPase